MSKKPQFFKRSMNWVINSVITTLTLPMSVLSKPLPYNYSDDAGKAVANQNKMEQYNEERYQSLMGAVNDLSSYVRNDFLTQKTSALDDVQDISERILSNVEEVNSELEKALNLTTGLNSEAFITNLNHLSNRLSNLTSAVLSLYDSHKAQLGILEKSINSFQQNSGSTLEFFKNNSTYLFEYFTNQTNNYIETQREKKSWDIFVNTANIILATGMIIAVYASYKKISNKLDETDIKNFRESTASLLESKI